MVLQYLNRSETEKFLKEMRVHRGRATELITVYIPSGYDINVVSRQLEGEKSTAKNIKSTSTRKNVTESLEKIIRALKDYQVTPEKGIALFAGNVSPVEGQSDMRIWEISPPEEIRVRLYRCDKEFVLEPLESMVEVSEIYALVVMDRKEATVGQLVGKRIEMLQNMTSGIPGKVKAGGQSAQRFHRITEGMTKDFYKRIADEVKTWFYENTKLKGILIGGPIPTKDEFVDGEYLPTPLQNKIIGVKDQGDTSEAGLKELVELSQDVLANLEIVREQKMMVRFFDSLGAKPAITPYKYEEVKKALEFGAVEILFLSKKYDPAKTDELKAIAESMGTEVEIISTETTEGDQFEKLGGIGAIQRFQI